MPSKTDEDLTGLLTKLYTMQEDVGAKAKTNESEKKAKAENVAAMGKGRAAKKTGSRFIELKSSIVDRLKQIHQLLEEEANRGKGSVAAGNNPKELIAAQAEMREQIRQAQEEWQELDALYKNEAKKRKSKFTKEELEVQETLVYRLQAEIEKVKEAQMKGYARGGGDVATTLNTAALASLDTNDLFAPNEGGGGGKGGGWNNPGASITVTGQQQQQLQMLEDRDQDFDRQLDELGEGIQDLTEIAQIQGEEVRRQNQMLEGVSNKIDHVNEHVKNVNAKMKDKLDEVGRSTDKLCVDIMCIVLMVGFGAVFYQIAKSSGAI
uniref:t-SNARE coiled-coil homology domain-containing protein n=1 Tax=Trieres chinensis TaxID=1514140 RepID=A0A7S2EAN5_TRICV|mmetsp:Transcript_14744/g.30231  ORF Transcript_14744/g.30231 Transcript_14744/m.30231 type:complete len:322 (+) Transcript_14744:83-1048(+)|eukprot:CAMPEP_0183292082 /NCGR_PEP_ID=MMETSP0160_2-20130417/1279_1 /TAXON_ID=2839 ORGANISM="Odontella Sinensis, Strain Grunow 1884" /NCGR_SAMPLE_ID=MMETSP0160_2 /ASSEMBLY_ACC=CAM_ASM_000250 /LENGTH=321 /DNA_ID=CAMNT_0025452991 /DNA_START=83 /DNA_END=1048 /DNA_ORIENTATION=+